MSRILSAVAVILAAGALVASIAIPGPAGPQGATGAIGTQGPAGWNYTADTTLRSWENDTGIYGAFGGPSGTHFGSGVNVRIPLSSSLAHSNVVFVGLGDPYPTDCPGPGDAAPGFLCVYELDQFARALGGIFDPMAPMEAGASRWGFIIFFTATGDVGQSYGRWTVTAP